jgi:hypothetical protein
VAEDDADANAVEVRIGVIEHLIVAEAQRIVLLAGKRRRRSKTGCQRSERGNDEFAERGEHRLPPEQALALRRV